MERCPSRHPLATIDFPEADLNGSGVIAGRAIRAKAAGVAAMEATRRRLEQRIDQALGDARADLMIRNARTLNLVTGDLDDGDIAICDDTIVGTRDNYHGKAEIDARGKIIVPGFIDSHVHCESTLVTPGEFDRCVLPHGTTSPSRIRTTKDCSFMS